MPPLTAPPAEINWAALSPRSLEIIKQVALRQSAGFTLDEVVVAMNREQPELRHVEPPPRGTYTKAWVQGS